MREVIALSPEEPDLKFAMIRDLESYGFAEHALSLGRATTPPAEVVRYYNNRGVAMSKTGDPKGALREYHAALRFYPQFRDNYRIWFNIAIAEANQKTAASVRRAEAALAKCLEMAPEFEKARALERLLAKATPKKAS
jgi:tetratricopeptide (TPR) repeat protein